MTDLTSVVRVDSVAAQIAAGVEMQASALNTIREAALEFVGGIQIKYETDDVPEIVAHGRMIYSDDFNGDHNLRAWFGDVATLALCADSPISFEQVRTVKGKKVKSDKHTTGEEAATMSKHDLKKAATALREDIGAGRAKGAGRPAGTPTAPTGDTKASTAKWVFNVTEFKALLAGLFEHSTGAVAALNKQLDAHGLIAIPKGDHAEFRKWCAIQEQATKKKEKSTS